MSNLKNEAILHVSMESDGRQSSSLSFYLSVPISVYPKRTREVNVSITYFSLDLYR